MMFILPINEPVPNGIEIRVTEENTQCVDDLRAKNCRVALRDLDPDKSAVAWSYPQDVAIWYNPDAVIKDLSEHGIETNIVRPSLLVPRSNK